MSIAWYILVAFVVLEVELGCALVAFQRGPLSGYSFREGLRTRLREPAIIPIARVL